jgi:hypothetical protein
MLVSAAAGASTALIVGWGLAGPVEFLGPSRLPVGPFSTTRVTNAINLSTGWIDIVPALLLVALGLAWWSAGRWAGGPSDGEDRSDSPERFAVHLLRCRRQSAWLSVLLVVTAAAATARLADLLSGNGSHSTRVFVGTAIYDAAILIADFIVVLVGLSVARRIGRVCNRALGATGPRATDDEGPAPGEEADEGDEGDGAGGEPTPTTPTTPTTTTTTT